MKPSFSEHLEKKGIHPNAETAWDEYVAYRNKDLSGYDFSFRNLKGIDLSGANLQNAQFFCTDLSEANLAGANLTGANLEYPDLSGSNLTGADLTDIKILHTIVKRMRHREGYPVAISTNSIGIVIECTTKK